MNLRLLIGPVYNCKPQKCGFFLWDDDAKPREEAAVLNNSRSEPKNRYRQDDSSTVRNDTCSRDSLPSPPSSNFARGVKRKIDFEDGGAFDWTLTGEENQQLAQALDSATTPAKPRGEQFQTPKRRRLPWMGEKDVSSSARSSKQTLLTPLNKVTTTPPDRTSTESSRKQAPDTTPTPARFRNADAPSTGMDHVEEEIIGVLRDHKVHLERATEQAIRQSLANYDRKVQGFIQG